MELSVFKYGRNRGATNPAKSKRRSDRWEATEVAPGIKMPFSILIPGSELRPPAPGRSTTKQIRWLPEPPANFAYELRLYFSKNSFTLHSPEGDVEELWQRPLADGWVLVLLAKRAPFPYNPTATSLFDLRAATRYAPPAYPMYHLTITHNFRALREQPKGQVGDNKKGAADNTL